MKHYCTDCGRQISKDIWDKQLQAPLPATRNVNGFICSECALDYDENGLLPNEYGYKEKHENISGM